MEHLKSLAILPHWNQEEDVMDGLAESLMTIAERSRGMKARREAAKSLEDIANEASSHTPGITSLPRPRTHRSFVIQVSKETLNYVIRWLRNQPLYLDEDLSISCTANRETKGDTSEEDLLFQEVCQQIRTEAVLTKSSEAHVDKPTCTFDTQSALQKHYQHPNFSEMSSFLGEASMSVGLMECHLKLNEQKKVEGEDQFSQREERSQWIKTKIPLEELFKTRSLKPDGPAEEISKVLLIGEAGTGKTALTKKIAHAWAIGEKWLQTFTAVYVLPIRNLKKEQQAADHSDIELLVRAIAEECFPDVKQGDRSNCFLTIEQHLEEPNTLVILDGLDERSDPQLDTIDNRIIQAAQQGTHKLILTSRPCGIEKEKSIVDIEVDHMGLDTEQRDRFVNATLEGSDTCNPFDLLAFIKEHHLDQHQGNVPPMANIPINLKILCALWEEKAPKMMHKKAPMGLPGLYRELTDHVWKRFKKQALAVREQEYTEAEQRELFQDLEKIALVGLKSGEIVIQPGTIKDALSDKQPYPLLHSAGFLLFQKVDRQYQFPHLTFQEYFSGRRLARLFLSGESRVVVKFLKRHMYTPHYKRTLSFMAGEIAEGMITEVSSSSLSGDKEPSIQALLELLKTVPHQEILGLQYLMLQLRLLNEWFLVTEDLEEKAETISSLEDSFGLGENLITWFNKGLHHYDSYVASTQVLHNTLLALLSEASGITEHYSDKLLLCIQIALKDNNYNVRRPAVQVLRLLIEKGEMLEQISLLILKVLGDSHYDVRHSAVQALRLLIEKGETLEQISPLILKTFGDSHHTVRHSAVKSIPILLEKGVSLEHIFSLILKFLGDGNKYARHSTVQSLPLLLEKGVSLEQIAPFILRALGDSNNYVRRAAVQSIPIMSERGITLEQIFSLILKTLGDSNDYARRAAVQSIPILLDKGATREQIFSLIQKALSDSNDYVRHSAVQAMSILLDRGVTLEQIFPLIQKAFGDSYYDVRNSVVQAIPILLDKGATLEQIFPLIQEALGDSNKYVRGSAVQLMPILLDKEASVEQIFPLILKTLGDSNDYARCTAVQSIRLLLDAGASVEQILLLIQKALGDSYYAIRDSAVRSIPILLDAGASVEQIFPLILKTLGDSYYDVRSSAVQSIRLLLEKGANVEQVFPLILKAFEDSNDDYTRRSAVQSLPLMLEKEVSMEQIFPIIQKALGDSNDTV